jgi:antirestriction protein
MNHEQHPPHEQQPDPTDEIPEGRVGDVHQADDQPSSPAEIRNLTADPPRIWVGSWLDYNDGVMHGDWIDATREPEDIEADIQAILSDSPTAERHGTSTEDWGVFDHEGFGSCQIEERASLSWVCAVASGITEHGPAFAAWADLVDDETQLDRFEDAYLGEHDSIEAYAAEQLDDLGYNDILDSALPEHIRRYIEFNVAGLAHDLWIGGDVLVCHRPDGGVWLFRNE